MSTASNAPLLVGAGLPSAYAAPASEVAELARLAERLGYDSAWLSDGGLGRAATLEPLTLLAYLAAVTERVRLGISVVIAPHRIPVQLAQMFATVDQLSDGRVIASLGIGHKGPALDAYGVPPQRRVRRYEEAIEVMRAAWSPDPVSHQGAAWTLDGVAVNPKPVQTPLPLWLGGNSDAAIDRAARVADGWTGAGSASWAELPKHLAAVHAALERHGRDPGEFVIGKRVYLAVDPDRARATAGLHRGFDALYGRAELADTAAISGSVDQLVEQLAPVVRSGCRFLLLNPAYDWPDQLTLIAEQLVPALRAAI